MKISRVRLSLILFLNIFSFQVQSSRYQVNLEFDRAKPLYQVGEKAKAFVTVFDYKLGPGEELFLEGSFGNYGNNDVNFVFDGTRWVYETNPLSSGDSYLTVTAYIENREETAKIRKRRSDVKNKINELAPKLKLNPESEELRAQYKQLKSENSSFYGQLNRSRKEIGSKSIKVLVKKPEDPKVTLEASTTSGAYPLSIDFEVKYELAEGRSLAYVVWDFGLGDANVEYSTGPKKSFRFMSEGEKLVTVMVVDNERDSTEAEITIIVVHPPEIPPHASIMLSKTYSDEAPFKIAYLGTDSSAPGGEIVSYQWDFGDGTTSDLVRGNHTYTEPGLYFVTLNVTDNKGNKNINIARVPVTVNCDIEVADSDVCLSVKGSDKRIWATSGETMVLQTKPAVKWGSEDLHRAQVLLRYDSNVVNVSSLAKFENNGDIVFDKVKLLSLIENFEDAFEITVQHQEVNGSSVSMTLKKVHFGTGTISGKVDRIGADIRVVEGRGLIDVKIKADENNSFKLEDLPFGYYTILSEFKNEFADAGVIVSPFEDVNLNIKLHNPTNPIGVFQKINRSVHLPDHHNALISQGKESLKRLTLREWDSIQNPLNQAEKERIINTRINKQFFDFTLFAPKSFGISERILDFELKGRANIFTLYYLLSDVAENLKDIFDIVVYYYDEFDQIKYLQISNLISEITQGEYFPTPKSVNNSNREYVDIKTSNTFKRVKVKVRVANLGRKGKYPEEATSLISVRKSF